MATSPNLGLNLTDSTEDTKSVDAWIDENTGTATTSNMMKIDTAVSAKQDKTNTLTAETVIADGDTIPFYDDSATVHRKTLWSNIKSVLKTYFDTLYAALSHTHGNINNTGAIGTTADLPIFTGTDGILVIKSTTSARGVLGIGSAGTLAYQTTVSDSNTSVPTGGAIVDLCNRVAAANAAETNYTTLMFRGESLNNTDTTPAVNGAIAWTYE